MLFHWPPNDWQWKALSKMVRQETDEGRVCAVVRGVGVEGSKVSDRGDEVGLAADVERESEARVDEASRDWRKERSSASASWSRVGGAFIESSGAVAAEEEEVLRCAGLVEEGRGSRVASIEAGCFEASGACAEPQNHPMAVQVAIEPPIVQHPAEGYGPFIVFGFWSCRCCVDRA